MDPEPEEILQFYDDDNSQASNDEEDDGDLGDNEAQGDEPQDCEPHDGPHDCEPPEDEPNDCEPHDEPTGDEPHDEPHNETEHASLSGKTVVLCGPGLSVSQLFTELEANAALAAGAPGDEIWAVDGVGRYLMHDRLFYMEHPSVLPPAPWLANERGIVYVSEKTPGVPTGVLYPVVRVVQELGVMYVDSSAAYALALAIFLRASKVRLFGLDFENDPAKRGCIEFLICKAVHSNVSIEIPSASLLLGNNMTVGDRLFGFRHSKDPFVMVVAGNERRLARFSEVAEAKAQLAARAKEP